MSVVPLLHGHMERFHLRQEFGGFFLVHGVCGVGQGEDGGEARCLYLLSTYIRTMGRGASLTKVA